MLIYNKIKFEKRIIIHNEIALNLVSFHFDDPRDTNDWLRVGKKPIMFCEKTWDEINDKKFKINTCKKGTVESIEIED